MYMLLNRYLLIHIGSYRILFSVTLFIHCRSLCFQHFATIVESLVQNSEAVAWTSRKMRVIVWEWNFTESELSESEYWKWTISLAFLCKFCKSFKNSYSVEFLVLKTKRLVEYLKKLLFAGIRKNICQEK